MQKRFGFPENSVELFAERVESHARTEGRGVSMGEGDIGYFHLGGVLGLCLGCRCMEVRDYSFCSQS